MHFYKNVLFKVIILLTLKVLNIQGILKNMASNNKLQKAKKGKNDEFYTQLSDIENEIRHYKEHFKGKTVMCNCDDPESSNFWKYFSMNFDHLGLKRLITTHYVEGESSYVLEFEKGDKPDLFPTERFKKTPLKGDGSFSSPECIELMKQADIVVTNPPFSLFREYLAQLDEYNKKFLIIGHQNAITYKETFKLIKENKLWLGYGFKGNVGFFINKHYENYATASDKKAGMIRVSGVHWFTNLDHTKRHEDIVLFRKYEEEADLYPRYDNYDGIEVSKVKDIPEDYDGDMGVPITFLHKFNPSQFEIVKFRKGDDEKDLSINGKCPYFRILIRKKK
jgi:hypothetical protein